MIKALILDLDDTIFRTSSMDSDLIQPFFDTLEEENDVLSSKDFLKATEELYKKPFKKVADEYGFSDHMITKSLEVLDTIDLETSIKPYQDYKYIKEMSIPKFLVTTGITKFQVAKIKALKISDDFTHIFIDDPMQDDGGKLKVFTSILERYKYDPNELLVIGDSIDNEIQAGKKLGMHTLLINRSLLSKTGSEQVITNFFEVTNWITKLH